MSSKKRNVLQDKNFTKSAEEAAEAIKNAAKTIRKASTSTREAVKTFRESGAVTDLVEAVHDAATGSKRYYHRC